MTGMASRASHRPAGLLNLMTANWLHLTPVDAGKCNQNGGWGSPQHAGRPPCPEQGRLEIVRRQEPDVAGADLAAAGGDPVEPIGGEPLVLVDRVGGQAD